MRKTAHFNLIAGKFYSHHAKMYNIKQIILYSFFMRKDFISEMKKKLKFFLRNFFQTLKNIKKPILKDGFYK